MAELKILFGTPRPFSLVGSEADETYEARTSGTAYVSDYDADKYPTQVELVAAVRAGAAEILGRNLAGWKVEDAVSADNKNKITALLTDGLALRGIKASVILNNIELTGESEARYRSAHPTAFDYNLSLIGGNDDGPKLEDLMPEIHGPVIRIASSWSSHGMSIGSGQSGNETLTWQADGTLVIERTDKADGREVHEVNIGGAEAAAALRDYIARSHVAEMAQVESIPSPFKMTDYSSSSFIKFTFDDSSVGGAPCVERSLDRGSYWKPQCAAISEIGELIRDCVNTGRCVEHTESTYDPRSPYLGMGIGMGAMGMGLGAWLNPGTKAAAPAPSAPPAAKNKLPDDPNKWVCACCGAENLGKFCADCGSPKPEKKEKQCECGFVSTGRFCPNCGRKLESQPAVSTEPVNVSVPEKVAAAPAPEEKIEAPAGWTCDRCGAEFQTGDNCEKCGAVIRKTELFSFSSYASTNPPRYEGGAVYEFSDSKLIYETYFNNDRKFRFISADVIEPAYEIIRKYGIDKWKDHAVCGMMGGRMSVRFRDGNEYAGSSTDQMGSVVQAAYYELQSLFGGSHLPVS